MDSWYIVIDGKPEGPFKFEQLTEKSVRYSTFIKSTDMDDYKEAHEIPQIRELLGFKHRVALPQYYATLDLRILASVIDYLLITAAYSFLLVIIISFTSSQFIKIAITISGLLLIPVTKFVYACIMESSPKQGSYGKYWLGLKVCDEAGLTLSFGKSIIRNLAKILSKITLGLGYLMGFFSKKQQCLHDIVAGTLVIRDRLI